jgi:hypothetical protein
MIRWNFIGLKSDVEILLEKDDHVHGYEQQRYNSGVGDDYRLRTEDSDGQGDGGGCSYGFNYIGDGGGPGEMGDLHGNGCGALP